MTPEAGAAHSTPAVPRWLRRVGAVLVVALAVAGGAFLASSTAPTYLATYSTPPCSGISREEPAGFDPWSGRPHGATWFCYDRARGGGVIRIDRAVPVDLAGRHAIPLPAGFVIGGLLALAAMNAIAHVKRFGGAAPDSLVE